MAQRKGQTGNPKGRKPGVPNNTTRFGREFILSMLESRRDRIGKELDALSGRDFINAVIALIAFVVPKPTGTGDEKSTDWTAVGAAYTRAMEGNS